MWREVMREKEKQEEQWKKPDEENKALSTETNGFINSNAFENMVNGNKLLENGTYKSYGNVKAEVRDEKSEMNVYYENGEGIWKCRNCPWTYQSGSQGTEHTEHPKQYLHMLINPITVNPHESCFYCEIKGIGNKRYTRDAIFAKGYSVTQVSGKTVHAEEYTIHETRQDGQNTQVHSSKDSLTHENSHFDKKLNGITLTETPDISNCFSGALLNVTIETNRYFEKHVEDVRDNLSISTMDRVIFPGKQVKVTEELKQTCAGTDTLFTVQESVEPRATQEPQDIISPCIKRVEYERFSGIEIVKSIVYGGLPELIASLGVLSSAVGADTDTLKVLALGLANMIGGLFIIAHNLWDLKNDHHSNPTNQITKTDSIQFTAQQDRYQQLLGRRENFWAHTIIALLSYLVFGMLPPVIYAFSFRGSDNKDSKLITVAVTSLVCIVILSTGKAYIQRPPEAYLKTISFYVIIVFMASGVTYAFGDLFKKILENLGWFG